MKNGELVSTLKSNTAAIEELLLIDGDPEEVALVRGPSGEYSLLRDKPQKFVNEEVFVVDLEDGSPEYHPMDYKTFWEAHPELHDILRNGRVIKTLVEVL